MDIRLKFIFAFLLLFSENNDINAFMMQCPSYQLNFQKIVGFRPPLNLITPLNLLYEITENSTDLLSPICWTICSNDENCIGYVMFLNNRKCYGFSIFENTDKYQAILPQIDLVADANAIYIEKVCLNVPDHCKTKLWTITKIPGSSLVFQGKKTITILVNKRECAEKCLHEKEFQCLSASFTPSYKNNQVRFTEPLVRSEILGRCILSDKDKTIQPDAFRAAPIDEEYIENQCYNRPPENEKCSYELYSNSIFIYSELKYIGLTQKECQINCSKETRFYCQGVSYYFEKRIEKSECYLHSEDLISMGPRSLQLKANSVYMRRVKCLDVSVICTKDEMVIKYSPKSWFRGKMYVSSNSEKCYITGNGTETTVLRLAIGSEIKENRCGILRAYEVTRNYQRIFISTLIVIQNNLNVQTQGDRLIKVGCIVSNGTTNPIISDAIGLESTLAFTQSEFINDESIINNLTTNQLPKITMQIIDINQQYETNDVQIGQNLELQIAAIPPDTPYDFQATSLIANSNKESNSILLIDENGCPTDPAIFPAFKKFTTSNQKILRAPFHAFKFAETSLVSFDVKIHFCLNQCPMRTCRNNQRKRRDVTKTVENEPIEINPSIQIKNPLYISSFTESLDSVEQKHFNSLTVGNFSKVDNFTESNNDKFDSLELPLNYQLYVHGPHLTDADKLIYGERGVILIAGIDNKSPDTICINYSLLIALLIFWMIFQTILMFCCCYVIKKYKSLAKMDRMDDKSSLHNTLQESMEYLEGRRVRWADQGHYGYTL